VETISSPFSEGGVTIDGKRNVTMYKQCYDKVCIMDNTEVTMRSDPEDDIIRVPDVQYINIGGSTYRMAFTYCIDIMILVEYLTQHKVKVTDKNAGHSYETAINPVSGKPFDISIYEMLKRRMSTEIKLYKYYIDHQIMAQSS
jgi:hypothetical protein